MRIVYFVGPNGSGKGTQVERLKKVAAASGHRLGVVTASELLKKNPVCLERMNAGKLVDDATVIKVVNDAIDVQDAETVIVDGFPRSVAQAESVLDRFDNGTHVLVLRFDLDPDHCIARCRGRGRGADDRPEVIKGRLDTFYRETMPGIKLLKESLPHLCPSIDGGQSEEAVFEAITQHLTF